MDDKSRALARGHSLNSASVEPSVLDRAAITPEPWVQDALCAQTDPEAFFPEKGGSTRDAKRICGTCPVTAECLDYALRTEERFGIWGAHSERERRRLKKDPAALAAAYARLELGEQPAAVPDSSIPRPWTEEDFAMIRRLNRAGRNDGEIARAIGRNRVEVTRRRLRMGIPAVPRARKDIA